MYRGINRSEVIMEGYPVWKRARGCTDVRPRNLGDKASPPKRGACDIAEKVKRQKAPVVFSSRRMTDSSWYSSASRATQPPYSESDDALGVRLREADDADARRPVDERVAGADFLPPVLRDRGGRSFAIGLRAPRRH